MSAQLPNLGRFVVPVVVLCGSAGSGKTTIMRALAGPRDLMIDVDEIKAELSGLPLYTAGDQWFDPAFDVRNVRLRELTRRPCQFERGWLVAYSPERHSREHWRRLGARVLVVTTSRIECERRLRRDPLRAERLFRHFDNARQWWRRFEPDRADINVRDAESARVAVYGRSR